VQEANGVTYTQAHGGHTLFKIHASKVVQLKNDHALLHDVMIELYGTDGSRMDRIEGNEFEYDQKAGTAKASGPVEMTLMRPEAAPAIAVQIKPRAAAPAANAKRNLVPAAAQTSGNREIQVKTSGLSFDQQSGVVTTAERVDFSMAQGSGSSMGASYDSQQGFLVLNRDVELSTIPGVSKGHGAGPVEIHAGHAECFRQTNLCVLRAAAANYRGGHADAAQAQILFRDDGTAVRLEATGGFTLATAAGAHLTAPTGSMNFDERNQPRDGHLEGGVVMNSVSGARLVHGTAPTVELEFTPQGALRHAHLERGVEIRSEEANPAASNGRIIPERVTRSWRSAVADMEFRTSQRAGHSRLEPATVHGFGGVVITGSSQIGNASPSLSKLAADEATGEFGPDSALTAMNGVGHASMEQTAATGAHETASGDRLEAHFAPIGPDAATSERTTMSKSGPETAQIQSATLNGHVVLIQWPAGKPGAPPQAEMRATAGHAEYESAGASSAPGVSPAAGPWLHLTESPRVEDGALQLTADKIDVAQTSGDALAYGNVKGSMMNSATQRQGAEAYKADEGGGINLGGQGPAHVIAAEAQLHRGTGEAIFRGHVRLWQQENSVAAPAIVLDRQTQTLVARTTDGADPVTVVLVSAGGLGSGKPQSAGRRPAAPSVIRARGGDLWYSNAERKAVMHGGVLGKVMAETAAATSVSDNVELQLAPAEAHAHGQAANGDQIERMTATGHVQVSSQGRRGVGEQLTYTGADGNYRLTGTSAMPPRMMDPQRGSVTGEALIFNSRDDSVSIEGGAQKTRTETTAPK
jgi:lipopolysaccharide export system protein LptA